jgi:hypothetical protein
MDRKLFERLGELSKPLFCRSRVRTKLGTVEVEPLQSRERALEVLSHVEMWSTGEVKLGVNTVPNNVFVLAHGLELNEAILGDERRAGELDGDGARGGGTRGRGSSGLELRCLGRRSRRRCRCRRRCSG